MTGLLFSLLLAVGAPETEAPLDTLQEATVTASAKWLQAPGNMAAQSVSLPGAQFSQRGISSPKSLGALVPNLHMPDYGTAMTSTIYMRGFGSRMENPVMGLYIDDVPVLDKNAYDFDFLDVRRVDFLSGPQGTLYGRNALTGLMAISSYSPENRQGWYAGASYGAANEVRARLSFYKGPVAVAGSFRHSDGFFENTFNGERDRYNGGNLFFRFARQPSPSLHLDHFLLLGALQQGMYPYGQVVEGEVQPVRYNDFSGYRRLSVLDATKLRFPLGPFLRVHSISSFQLLWDRMDMDQDYTVKKMFTLSQAQRQWAFTQEFVLRPGVSVVPWWDSQTGLFAFYKSNGMHAPVTFKQDGIQELMLDNANRGLAMLGLKTDFLESSFPINSDFAIQTWNVALYHESVFTFGGWQFTAGARLDYEGNHMRWDCSAQQHIAVVAASEAFSDYRFARTEYAGDLGNGYVEFLPKISALYSFDFGLKAYGSYAKGYRAGGFNTQIFSDILQDRMMAQQYGVHLTDTPVSAENTSYLPESSHNLELGVKYAFAGRDYRLRASLSGYYILCENQQITVFPQGKSTGRMMKNAGTSRSTGVEAQLGWAWKGLEVSASYGNAFARFLRYNDGNNDYAGKAVPYAPEATAFARLSYQVWRLVLGVDTAYTGRIFWDEANTSVEAPHAILGADFSLSLGPCKLLFRMDNITNNRYKIFQFTSVGNTFAQLNRPLRWRIGLTLEL